MIQIAKAQVNYGQLVALDLADLSLKPGLTALVGVNGAGKSTLLNGLSQGQDPRGWQVLVDDLPRSRKTEKDYLLQLGLMPQSFSFAKNFTVAETLKYLGWLRGIPSKNLSQAVDQALARVRLTERKSAKVGGLSGGMLRRVGLAQAIIHQPKFLLLDEPTAGLDPEQRLIFRELLAELPPSGTTIISSHLMEDIRKLADRLLILHQGKVAFHGTLTEFQQLPSSQAVPEGDLEMAFLHLIQRGTH